MIEFNDFPEIIWKFSWGSGSSWNTNTKNHRLHFWREFRNISHDSLNFTDISHSDVELCNFRAWSAANVRKYCRAWTMLQNEYLLAGIGVDTAGNEPRQVCCMTTAREPCFGIVWARDRLFPRLAPAVRKTMPAPPTVWSGVSAGGVWSGVWAGVWPRRSPTCSASALRPFAIFNRTLWALVN